MFYLNFDNEIIYENVLFVCKLNQQKNYMFFNDFLMGNNRIKKLLFYE